MCSVDIITIAEEHMYWRPGADSWWWDQISPPLNHPIAYPSEPQFSGLYDKDGRPIYKSAEPVGFPLTKR